MSYLRWESIYNKLEKLQNLAIQKFTVCAIDWMCPPEFLCCKHNPQCNNVEKWEFQEVIRLWGLCPHKWINVVIIGLGSLLWEWVCYKSEFDPLLFYLIHMLYCSSAFGHWDDVASGSSTDVGPLTLDFPVCRTMRNTFFFINYAICGILL